MSLRSVEEHCKDLQDYWATPLLHKQSTQEQLYPCANFCILCILLQHVTILFTDSAAQKNWTNIRDRGSSSKTAFSLNIFFTLRQAMHSNHEPFPLYFTLPTLPTTTFFFHRARRLAVSLRSTPSFLSCNWEIRRWSNIRAAAVAPAWYFSLTKIQRWQNSKRHLVAFRYIFCHWHW